MVDKEQKKDDQTETKEKIKVAASKLFAHKGFDGASMRKIAANAGVSLASINYHFRSKQDLYNEILTSSPWIRLLRISPKTESTRVADSFLDSPTFLKTASLSVDLVVVFSIEKLYKINDL